MATLSLPCLPPPPGHGYCSCGRCICEEGWFGKICQFPRKCEMTDVQSKEQCETGDGVLCSGKGEQRYNIGNPSPTPTTLHFIELLMELLCSTTYIE